MFPRLSLKALSKKDREVLAQACKAAALDLVIQEDDGVLLMVPEPQIKQARRIILQVFGGKLPAGASWMD